MAEFHYVEPFPLAKDETPYRKVASDHVSVATFEGQEVLKVAPEALRLVAREAFRDVAFLYRPGHLAQLAAVLDDPEASENDRGVVLALLRNAEVAAGFVLPMCQDTGTATIVAKKGERVFTGGGDAEHLSRGIFETYARENLRYSQTLPLTMYDEANSGTNLPAQIDVYATDGMEYHFLMLAKGGGSANKTFLFQETKAVLNPGEPREVPVREDEAARHRGLPALPPGVRDRRHLGGGVPQDGEARLGARPRRAARRPAASRGRRSATSSSRRSSSRPRARPGSARSSAASTSRSTRASSGCRATGPPARSAWASPARPTATSWRRSTARGSGSRSWSATRRASFPSATAAPRHRPKVSDRPQPPDAARSSPSSRATRSRPPSRSAARSWWRATSRTPSSRSGSTAGKACRSTSRTTRSTTRARPRRPRGCRRARSGPRRPGAWTRTSICSSRTGRRS